MAELIPLDELPHEPHSHEFEGSDHGDVPAIHGAGRFDTEWLAGLDATWTSKPRDIA